MDFFDFNNVKAQKAEAIIWYSHLPSLTKLFRLIELCLALLLLSWIFNRLPFLVTISIEFFQRIAGIISSPVFVFMFCNVIIVTLIVKSGRFSGENPAADNAETEFYEKLLKNNENCCYKSLSSENPPPNSPPHATEEIEYQDKEIITSKTNAVIIEDGDDGFDEKDLSSHSDSDSGSHNQRVYRRSKSEKLERTDMAKAKKLLRRSETEKCMNAVKSGAGRKGSSIEDELSDEEFQRAVDEFIAKHLRFRRQESLTIVL